MNFEKILAILEKSYPGLRKDGLMQLARMLALQVSNEEELNSVIGKLTQESVEGFVKSYRSDVDKEVSESSKKIEARLKAKYDPQTMQEPTNKDRQPGGGPKDDSASIKEIIAQAVAEQIKPLNEMLSGFEQEKVLAGRKAMLQDALSRCKNKSFSEQTLKDFGRMSFKDQEAFNEYLEEKKADIETANQEFANSQLGNGIQPLLSSKDQNGISSAVSEYLKGKGENKMGGKPLT